jgi:hypothetical protein
MPLNILRMKITPVTAVPGVDLHLNSAGKNPLASDCRFSGAELMLIQDVTGIQRPGPVPQANRPGTRPVSSQLL